MTAPAPRLTLTVDVFRRPGRQWVRVTAHGIVQGRYSSIASAGFEVPEADTVDDSEELVAVVLANLGAVAYGP